MARRSPRRRKARPGRMSDSTTLGAKANKQVFSGDQLNGQKTSYDARSVSAKFTKPVIDRQIPWCAIFGNHDSEIAEDRPEQMRALASLPYSLAQAGPSGIDGIGNCAYFPCVQRVRADCRCRQASFGRCVSCSYLYVIFPRFGVLSEEDVTMGRCRLRLYQRVSPSNRAWLTVRITNQLVPKYVRIDTTNRKTIPPGRNIRSRKDMASPTIPSPTSRKDTSKTKRDDVVPHPPSRGIRRSRYIFNNR